MSARPDGGEGRASRLLLRFLELQIPMGLGAAVCYLLGRSISGTPGIAAIYRPGTYVFAIGDVLFLIVPVVGWMISRGRGRGRWQSVQMALAMFAPVAVIALVGELAGPSYLLWLVTGMYPAMCLGMILSLLYRPEHITARVDGPAGA
jgi:hypothetical protein